MIKRCKKVYANFIVTGVILTALLSGCSFAPETLKNQLTMAESLANEMKEKSGAVDEPQEQETIDEEELYTEYIENSLLPDTKLADLSPFAILARIGTCDVADYLTEVPDKNKGILTMFQCDFNHDGIQELCIPEIKQFNEPRLVENQSDNLDYYEYDNGIALGFYDIEGNSVNQLYKTTDEAEGALKCFNYPESMKAKIFKISGEDKDYVLVIHSFSFRYDGLGYMLFGYENGKFGCLDNYYYSDGTIYNKSNNTSEVFYDSNTEINTTLNGIYDAFWGPLERHNIDCSGFKEYFDNIIYCPGGGETYSEESYDLADYAPEQGELIFELRGGNEYPNYFYSVEDPSTPIVYNHEYFGYIFNDCLNIRNTNNGGTFSLANTDAKSQNFDDIVNRIDWTQYYSTPPQHESMASGIADDKVEDKVLEIRKIYNQIQSDKQNGRYSKEVSGDVTIYRLNGEIISVEIRKGYTGNKYARYYYYKDGKLIFAYWEGSDSHRLYYDNGRLFRWRYCQDAKKASEAVNHDNEGSDEFYDWGKGAFDEAQTYSYQSADLGRTSADVTANHWNGYLGTFPEKTLYNAILNHEYGDDIKAATRQALGMRGYEYLIIKKIENGNVYGELHVHTSFYDIYSIFEGVSMDEQGKFQIAVTYEEQGNSVEVVEGIRDSYSDTYIAECTFGTENGVPSVNIDGVSKFEAGSLLNETFLKIDNDIIN